MYGRILWREGDLLPRAPTPGSQLRDLCTDAIGRDVLSSQVGGIAKKCVFTTVGNGTFRLRAVQQNGSSEGVRVSVRSAKAVASVHISPRCEPGSLCRALAALSCAIHQPWAPRYRAFVSASAACKPSASRPAAESPNPSDLLRSAVISPRSSRAIVYFRACCVPTPA